MTAASFIGPYDIRIHDELNQESLHRTRVTQSFSTAISHDLT